MSDRSDSLPDNPGAPDRLAPAGTCTGKDGRQPMLRVTAGRVQLIDGWDEALAGMLEEPVPDGAPVPFFIRWLNECRDFHQHRIDHTGRFEHVLLISLLDFLRQDLGRYGHYPHLSGNDRLH